MSIQFRKKGFTLVELVVVLVIIGIVSAIGIPTASHFIKNAEYRKNEENAKTAYLAAESVLTWYRSSGQWEAFREKVKADGVLNNTFTDGNMNGRIYAVSVNPLDGSDSHDLVMELLKEGIYSEDFFAAEIAIEVDVESGQVYSAFYGTRCDGLTYGAAADRLPSISAGDNSRAPEVRREVLLGYYSVEDVSNVVEFKQVRLKVTTINLVNSETLSLNWSGNSRNNDLDVKYIITFYEKNGDKKLFSTEVELSKLTGALKDTETGDAKTGMAALKLKVPDSAAPGGEAELPDAWNFPLTYQKSGSSNGRFSMVLDGMMTADLAEAVKAKGVSVERQASTSITRLGKHIAQLSDLLLPQDIYAEIQAQPAYGTVGSGDAWKLVEYKTSRAVRSNTENTLFAKAEIQPAGGVDTLQAEITRYRHLSNIRYYDETKAAQFTLTVRNLDWTSAGVGMYGVSRSGTPDYGKVGWNGVIAGGQADGEQADEEQALDFPSIPLLGEKHTFTGNGGQLSHLHLGAGSVPDDQQIENLYGAGLGEKSHYLGLFSEAEGRIEGLTLSDPVLRLTGETAGAGTGGAGDGGAEGHAVGEEGSGSAGLPAAAEAFDALYGVGILCGRSQGSLENIAVKTTKQKGAEAAQESQTVLVRLKDRDDESTLAMGVVRKPAAVGGVVGVLAGKKADGSLEELTSGVILKDLTAEGRVTVYLPSPEGASWTADASTPSAEERAKDYPYGVGGIVGHAELGNGVQLADCKNYGDINGNLFTGGIAGSVKGAYNGTADVDSIQNGYNEGLILCLSDNEEEDKRLEGRYFGGIAGYGGNAQISACVNASKYKDETGFDASKRDALLHGHYAGGIIGYGSDSQLSGCSTQKGSYVLGSCYVGGIAGGLSNQLDLAITGKGAVRVTVNGGFVIGDRYVGGIVGKNDGAVDTAITNCINNGVAAGYERYVGGIVGYNGGKGIIEDCVSFFSDIDGSVYQTIVEKWKAAGDCVGGLAGYNNGLVKFSAASEGIYVKSVASIVVGGNYVGGVIGFNDIDGDMDVAYTLMGGRIYGSGNAVGGCIGLNASEEVLKRELTIRPTAITGKYHVGGVIGANVVDITAGPGADAVAMTKVKADNRLGSIRGNAFVGGVIGYQRTYTEEQLRAELSRENSGFLTAPGSEDLFGKDGTTLRLLSYIDGMEKKDKEGTGGAEETIETAETAGNLLPLLGKGTEQDTPVNVPTEVLVSENKNSFTIGNRTNTEDDKQDEYNNIPVYADLFAGGIVGYCERGSRLHIVNSKNAGSLSRLPESVEGKGTALGAYLASKEVEADITKLDKEDTELEFSIGGGIIGANLENQIIDHCVNTGMMNDFSGLGGIVGFNAGGVFNCRLSDNFGNLGLNYIGGVAGLNVHAGGAGELQDGSDRKTFTYEDVNGVSWEKFVSGTIAKCSTQENRTVSGKSCVGGIAGFNLPGAEMTSNKNNANVTGAGDYVGGMAGANSGSIFVSGDKGSNPPYTITGNSGAGIGGIVGWNKEGGSVDVVTEKGEGAELEIVAIDKNVTITGKERVGGIIGINEGRLSAENEEEKESYLVCRAKTVHATDGYAGGIIGEARRRAAQNQEQEPANGMVDKARIARAINKSENVTADRGPAGGIVAVNQEGFWLESCTNLGNVNSDDGYAGGIAAENYGWIWRCKVGDQDREEAEITISSRGEDAIGAVCAVNHGEIWKSAPEKSKTEEKDQKTDTVILSGTAGIAGGIAGRNAAGGRIGRELESREGAEGLAYNITYMPHIDLSAAALTVGGAAGQNQSGTDEGESRKAAAVIRNVTAKGLLFRKFNNYRYLGGIAGENRNGALVEKCLFSNGEIVQGSGIAAGNCYGGVAGSNDGTLRDCRIEGITIDVTGIYTATSTSTAQEKERLSSHIGGIAGKNEKNGLITGCLIAMGEDEKGKAKPNSITVKNGMAGGVAGYNKNRITLSGDALTDALMQKQTGADGSISPGVASVKDLIKNAKENSIAADAHYVNWNDGGDLKDQTYNGTWRAVSADRSLLLYMTENGSLGGITAYNAPTGEVNYCATGDWFLNNQSGAIGVGTGGVIGMNESEKNLTFLLNQAFVGRQLSSNMTNRFAGGIIGNQNNTTGSGWTIQNCVNYGTVYCKKAHYSGGIMGQWTGTGGSIEKCYNFGNLQTTYGTGWVGASGGIVAQLYHAYENNEYHIAGCANYGNIYGRTGESTGDCANDSAGILGNVTTYKANDTANGQRFTIHVTDCVNGAGVKIYSNSMASGIVGFFSSDNPTFEVIKTSTANIKLHILRCRNYAQALQGSGYVAGIFGDRYGETGAANTVLKYCFSVNPDPVPSLGIGYNKTPYPVVSFDSFGSNYGKMNAGVDTRFNFYLANRDDIDSFPKSTAIFKNPDKANDDKLRRANADWAYSVMIGTERYIIHIDNTYKDPITFDSLKVAGDEVYIGDKKIGNVLFKINDSADCTKYASMNAIVQRGGDFDYFQNFDNYVREFCFTQAGLLLAPEKVVLSKTEDGLFKLEVDTSVYADADKVEYVATFYRKTDGAASTETVIPAEAVALPQGSGLERIAGTDTFRFDTTTCIFDLDYTKIAKEGELFVRVTAREKENPGTESAAVDSNSVPLGTVLPEPELRIELVPYAGGGYQYRFRLTNGQEYPSESNPKVHVKPMNDSEFDFDVDGTANYGPLAGDSLQQLVVWVTADENASSAEVSVPVYLPKDKPSIAVNDPKPSAIVSGASLKDLTVTVTLTGPGKTIDTPPVYRAELVGTWTDADGKTHKDYVFRTDDILTVADGTAKASFTDFEEMPEEEAARFADASDIKVRVWYAQSGLGPVYTYYTDLALGETPNTRTEETVTTPEGGEETQWKDAYTPVLEDNTFTDYRWTSKALFEWPDAPVLMEIPAGKTSLEPTINPANGHLEYTFTWDEGKSPENNEYIVTLTGGSVIGADGRLENPVSIVTNMPVKGGALTLDAETWPYQAVELSVTRKGYTQGNNVSIGKTSTRAYPVKRRLPSPARPVVENPDWNELQYRIEWRPVAPETAQAGDSGCSSYEISIRLKEPDPDIGEDQPITVAVKEEGVFSEGVYRKLVDLEKYAGKEVVISVKAMAAADDPVYVQSVDSITNTITVPERISAPEIEKWERSWTHPAPGSDDPDNSRTEIEKAAKTVEDFEEGGAGGLKVTLAGSTPPGGSSYLTKAYVFETEEQAKEAQQKLADGKEEEIDMGTVVAYYPLLTAEGQWTPAGMEPEGNDGKRFSHTLSGLSAEHAGKYILFTARISSGGGRVSSKWVVQNGTNTNGDPSIWRLPYVQLPTPEAEPDDNVTRDVEVRFLTDPASGISESMEEDENNDNYGSTDDTGSGEDEGGSEDGTGSGGDEGGSEDDTGSGGDEGGSEDDTGNGGEGGSTDDTGSGGEGGSTDDTGNGGEGGSTDDTGNGGDEGGSTDDTGNGGDEGGSGDDTGSTDDTGNGGDEGGSTDGTGSGDSGENETESRNQETEGTGDVDAAKAISRARAAYAAAGRTSRMEANMLAAVGRIGAETGAEKAVYGMNARMTHATLFRTLAAGMDVISGNSADDTEEQQTEAAELSEDEAALYAVGAQSTTEETWTAAKTDNTSSAVLSWSSVTYADAYYFVLKDDEITDADGKVTQQETVAEFKVVETKDEEHPENSKAAVYGKNTDGSGQWIAIGETGAWDAADAYIFDLSEDEGGKQFNTYGRTVTGTHRVGGQVDVDYEADLKTTLKIAMENGAFTYTLCLPDCEKLNPPDGSQYGPSIEITGGVFTDSVRVWADMGQNEDTDPANWSDAYVKSEEYEITFKK